jgi:hypothetical protein
MSQDFDLDIEIARTMRELTERAERRVLERARVAQCGEEQLELNLKGA